MDYPPAVLEKAQRLEQLLLRVASGEALDQANEALGFDLDQRRLARCQAKYETGGRTWEALIDGRHGHSRKAHSALREWLYVRKKEDDSLRAPQLAIEIEEKFGVALSLEAIYGFTYKYLILEHFLGQLTRVQVGASLAEALATPATSTRSGPTCKPGILVTSR